MDLKTLVYEALQNGLDNGFDFHEVSDEEVAVDLGTFCADLEDQPQHVLVPHITSFFAERGTRG